MDKNTVIGLLLMLAVMIGFSIFMRPSKEELAAKRVQDSLQQIQDSILLQQKELAAESAFAVSEQQKMSDSIKGKELSENLVVSFFSAGTPVGNISSDSTIVSDSLQNAGVIDSTLSIVKTGNEQFVTLENNKIRLVFNTKGGRIHSAQLKDFSRYTGDSLFLFDGDDSRFNLELYNRNSIRLNTESQYFTPLLKEDGKTLIMRLQGNSSQYLDFVYSLPNDEYMIDFDIRLVGMNNGLHPESLTNFRINWDQKIRQQEKGRKFEERYARVLYKYEGGDVKKMSEGKDSNDEYSEPLKWIAYKDQYFVTTMIGDKPFDNAIISSKVLSDKEYIKDYKSELMIPITVNPASNEINAGFKYYFGPVHYTTLKSYDKEYKDENLQLSEQVELGYKFVSWVNKWLVIPVFNFFLKQGWNMGLIILILTLMVKIIIFPMTYKSYRSTAKMRVLRPQIKEIEEKYPGQDQETMMKRQQATMELYNKVGVSPMSGCLPMILQFPVILALFWFFPSAIELRHQSFLWADDLSTYDSLISWTGNIPLITNTMGNHISIFCLLMTVVNTIFSVVNMNMSDTGQQQMAGMKFMPVFMSLFMFFFLNSYPAGLNYYYLLSTLISMILTFMLREFMNEEKLLAQLEANKGKIKKKSGFMSRMEQMQKDQEKVMRQRAKENAKKSYKR
ncbi:MAG: membrane protein insertase YidC [Dysgonamonadaceae bacterium]|jgi:YidC/Oxa1 family membrane protein insertase|nr:membrane protein insertase YidC [Dysgonamonadaceae bacterium]